MNCLSSSLVLLFLLSSSSIAFGKPHGPESPDDTPRCKAEGQSDGKGTAGADAADSLLQTQGLTERKQSGLEVSPGGNVEEDLPLLQDTAGGVLLEDGEPDDAFTDLGEAGFCALTKPKTLPDGHKVVMPLHWHLARARIQNTCKGWCLAHAKDNSMGPGYKCYGYSLTSIGTCFFYREGPIRKGPITFPVDPKRRCFAVTSLLPKAEEEDEGEPDEEEKELAKKVEKEMEEEEKEVGQENAEGEKEGNENNAEGDKEGTKSPPGFKDLGVAGGCAPNTKEVSRWEKQILANEHDYWIHG